jgi:hypothetical protein
MEYSEVVKVLSALLDRGEGAGAETSAPGLEDDEVVALRIAIKLLEEVSEPQ